MCALAWFARECGPSLVFPNNCAAKEEKGNAELLTDAIRLRLASLPMRSTKAEQAFLLPNLLLEVARAVPRAPLAALRDTAGALSDLHASARFFGIGCSGSGAERGNGLKIITSVLLGMFMGFGIAVPAELPSQKPVVRLEGSLGPEKPRRALLRHPKRRHRAYNARPNRQPGLIVQVDRTRAGVIL